MLAFALPIILSNLLQQLYNAVDSLIVGNFIGSTALAAVGSSASMIMLLVGFINGVSLGAGVVIARFYGADDRENPSRALHTTVAVGIAAGLVLTVVGVLLTPQILRWMGTPGDVIGNSIAYFRVYFLGSSAVVLYNMCASILQSVGDSRSPMKYLIFASLTNVVLDLLFVAVFRWGVASAALATILSQTLSAPWLSASSPTPGTATACPGGRYAFTAICFGRSSIWVFPPAFRTRSSPWPTSSSRPTSTPSARRLWRAAVPTAKSRALPFCRSPAFPWPWPPL